MGEERTLEARLRHALHNGAASRLQIAPPGRQRRPARTWGCAGPKWLRLRWGIYRGAVVGVATVALGEAGRWERVPQHFLRSTFCTGCSVKALTWRVVSEFACPSFQAGEKLRNGHFEVLRDRQYADDGQISLASFNAAHVRSV